MVDRYALRIVNVPSTKLAIQPAPGFQKKGLADYHLELLGRCGFACSYCSSETGNYLRINGGAFAEAGEKQTGVLRRHTEDPPEEHTVYAWPTVLETLEAQLVGKPKAWGAGKTLVVSMLTDAFSQPGIQRRHGRRSITEKALDLLLRHTAFRIRVLTKSAAVGSQKWVNFFAVHPGRFTVGLSIGTLDDGWAAKVERGTSPPSKRLEALRKLQDAAVPTFGMLCPLFLSAIDGDGLERLLDAIRPELCEDIWYEPYNDRANWRRVQAGHAHGSWEWTAIEKLFAHGRGNHWSDYACRLYERMRIAGERGGWFNKTHYLLYEGDIVARDAGRLRDLDGILLQGKPDENGLSRNQAIADVQRAAKLTQEELSRCV